MTTREEWLRTRQTGIGGSDVAAILGISRWKTPLDVYNSKVGELEPDEQTPSQEWGTRLEPVIRRKYAETVGMAVDVPETMRHKDYPFMLANLDGIRSDGRLLEIKTARFADGWGEEGTDEIPDYYLTQVQHYLAVTGAQLCDVAVLIGQTDFRIYTVERDDELIDMLIREEQAFWKLVQDKTPPAPVSLAEAVKKLALSPSTARKVEADDDITDAVYRLRELQDDIRELKEQEECLKQSIQAYMKDADTLTIDGIDAVTWKTGKPVARLDTAELKAKQPDVYAQYLKTTEPQRRFTLKKTKGEDHE